MKNSLVRKALVPIAILAAVCMVVISRADTGSKTKTATEKLEAPGPNRLTPWALPVIAGNYDVDLSTMTASSGKGRDGSACSSDDECQHVCEGGSCCTAHGDPCNSTSHCCGYQNCTNGVCP